MRFNPGGPIWGKHTGNLRRNDIVIDTTRGRGRRRRRPAMSTALEYICLFETLIGGTIQLHAYYIPADIPQDINLLIPRIYSFSFGQYVFHEFNMNRGWSPFGLKKPVVLHPINYLPRGCNPCRPWSVVSNCAGSDTFERDGNVTSTWKLICKWLASLIRWHSN